MLVRISAGHRQANGIDKQNIFNTATVSVVSAAVNCPRWSRTRISGSARIARPTAAGSEMKRALRKFRPIRIASALDCFLATSLAASTPAMVPRATPMRATGRK